MNKENKDWRKLDLDPSTTTIAEAKREMTQYVLEGLYCPVCKQVVKVYERKLHSSMGFILILLDRRLYGDEAIHVGEFLASLNLPPKMLAAIRGDWTKMKFWDFVKQDPAGRTAYWQITEAGRQFARGRSRVPGAVFVYNDTPVEVKNKVVPLVDIRDVLGTKFNFEQLIAGIQPGEDAFVEGILEED